MKGMRALIIIGALFVGLDFAFAQDCSFDEDNLPGDVSEYMTKYKINRRHFEGHPGKAECLDILNPEAKVLVVERTDNGDFNARVAANPSEVGEIKAGSFLLTRK